MPKIDENLLSTKNPDGTGRNAIGSPFLNGSFSGADIKVVVHLPVTKMNLQNHIRQLEDRKTVLEARKLNPTFSVGATIRLDEQIDFIDRKITNFSKINKGGNSNQSTTKVLLELQTISYSIYREKTPVRFLGSVYPRAYVRGSRTIAGSMIFTMFNRSPFQDLLTLSLDPYSTGQAGRDHDYYHNTTVLIDQLPPLDMSLIFNNEYGSTSYMNLWGVEFVSDGATFSIEDLFSENVVQYVARDVDIIRDVLQRETDVNNNIITEKFSPKTASQLYWDELASEPGGEVRRRWNPYI